MDTIPTNLNQKKYKPDHDPLCPSCGLVEETCSHVLLCEEIGRVYTLGRSIDNMATWLHAVGTDPQLCQFIVEYTKGRGGMSMIELTRSDDWRFRRLADSQDMIGWRRFMEGMISKEWITIQKDHFNLFGGSVSPAKWAQGLVTRLLEVTHGQWLYENVQVHDTTTGILATQRKEKLQKEIEDPILGGRGLEEEDKFLLEINLEDLETTSGDTQEYCLLAITSAREARLLREQSAAN